ncbi:sensor histidine kinase [Allosphingosinicella indica]|uniref:histidine kinase n=1 Tax=Allosphingosinicella indica TaxID=941907 RepID=A0A1X7GXI8_9SPHN|nr:HAMP domain-containing sensor histidine kinase [Allosphingosinicella indica]SMF75798.1 histidine kinase [Allosphingosinicella indica]
MSALEQSNAAPVRGRVDRDGRLIEAEPMLEALHLRAGGVPGGPIAVPQIAALVRLSRRLGIVVSRAVVAADGDDDLDLWVRADPGDEGASLSVSGWRRQPARPPADAPQHERDADFLRAGADWMWETDARLNFTALSSAAIVASGRPTADLIGRQLTRLFRLEEDRDGNLPILTALADHRRFDRQVAILRGPTRARYRLAGIPMIDGAGRFAGFRGSATGIGDPDIPANDTRDPDAPAFGERLDTALRVPLDHIVSAAEAMRAQAEGPLGDDYVGYAGDIASAGRHLLALVDDLVDLQAIERTDFRPSLEALDLADIARRAAGLLAVRGADRGVKIDTPGEDEQAPAIGEFRRTLQILTNLVANAVRYSPEGAMVWIRTEREGDIVAVVVADQGKGIAPDDHERIFHKFERVDPAEPGGTGLGLYIARRLARAMGGDIIVDSAPGQGARFTLTLPAA